MRVQLGSCSIFAVTQRRVESMVTPLHCYVSDSHCFAQWARNLVSGRSDSSSLRRTSSIRFRIVFALHKDGPSSSKWHLSPGKSRVSGHAIILAMPLRCKWPQGRDQLRTHRHNHETCVKGLSLYCTVCWLQRIWYGVGHTNNWIVSYIYMFPNICQLFALFATIQIN